MCNMYTFSLLCTFLFKVFGQESALSAEFHQNNKLMRNSNCCDRFDFTVSKITAYSFNRLDRTDNVTSLEQKEQRFRFRFGFPKKAQAAITYSI